MRRAAHPRPGLAVAARWCHKLDVHVALATCLVKPEPDPDEEPLRAALLAHDLDVSVVAWDAPGVDWSAYGLVVLRSTWNYPHALDAFLGWLEATGRCTTVLNPPWVARRNLDKRYLLELAARGVPTVPTVVLEANASVDLDAVLAAHGLSDIVIKPVVGAASFRTRRFGPRALPEARAFLAANLSERAMLVQPYQHHVEDVGERALVWLDGELSHAIRKAPRFEGGHEAVSEALDIAQDERALATAALAPLRDELLYARIDMVRDAAGAPRVMELELVEPSLFLAERPAALARFASAIARRAKSQKSP